MANVCLLYQSHHRVTAIKWIKVKANETLQCYFISFFYIKELVKIVIAFLVFQHNNRKGRLKVFNHSWNEEIKESQKDYWKYNS